MDADAARQIEGGAGSEGIEARGDHRRHWIAANRSQQLTSQPFIALNYPVFALSWANPAADMFVSGKY